MTHYDVMLQKRLSALEDLYLSQQTGEVLSLVKTCKSNGISPGRFISGLRNPNIIKGGRRDTKWCTGEPTETMAKAVLAFERNTTDFAERVQKETAGKVGLSMVIEATELGVRYSLTGKELEAFVKDVLDFTKRHNR